MRLIWSNAKTYNAPDHEVHKSARSLSTLFEKKVASVLTTHQKRQKIEEFSPNIQSIMNSPPQSTGQLKDDISELFQSIKDCQEEISSIRKQDAQAEVEVAPQTLLPALPSPKRARGRPRKLQQPELPLTRKEKTDLANNVQLLAPVNLSQVISMLQKTSPQLLHVSAEEIEIDVDSLETDTLRKLEAFVKRCLNAQRKKERKENSWKNSETLPMELPTIVQDTEESSDSETENDTNYQGNINNLHTSSASLKTESVR